MKTKKTLQSHNYYLYIALVAVGLFTTAHLAFSESAKINENTVNSCVAKMFEFDREQVFSDVPIQQWYTHAANFLIILDPSFGAQATETDDSSGGQQFKPDEPITQTAFVNMISKYEDALVRPIRKIKLKDTDQMSQKDIAYVIEKTLGVSQNTVLQTFKQQNIQSDIVLRKEAAYILFKVVERNSPQSIEKILCTNKALENSSDFEARFGEKMIETPSESPEIIEVPTITPAPITPVVISSVHPTSGIINFAPVNPRAGAKAKVIVTSEPGARLQLFISTGFDIKGTYLPLEEKSNGKYEGELSSTWAGTYRVSIMDETTIVGSSREITFAPDFPTHVGIETITSQAQSASKKEVTVSLALRDKFENSISAEPRDFRVRSDSGAVKKIEKLGSQILATIETNNVGVSNISVEHLNRRGTADAKGKTTISFSPVVLDVPKGIEPGTVVSVPIHAYLPKEKGQIAGYKINLSFEKKDFTVLDITDIDTRDGFDAAKITSTENGLLLQQQTKTVPKQEVVAVGVLRLVASNDITSGTLFVPEAHIINDREKIISSEPSTGTVDDLMRWWYAIKPIKNVCLDIWMTEGSDVTRTEAMSDAQKAANMYVGATQRSSCPFFINFDINFHRISQAEWTASVDTPGGTPNRLDDGEEANLKNNFTSNASCVQIWYVPEIQPLPDGTNIVGYSYPNNGGIAINNHRDGKNVAMGHEMNHQLSGNDVLDSPFDVGNVQGANDAKNSMNYNDLGFGLTKAQCELIKQKPYIP